MLEFKKNRYGNWTAAIGKWHFQINQIRVGVSREKEPFWVLAARGGKQGDSLNTGTHKRFETLEAAAMFCEDLATGKVTLEELQAQFNAEDDAREQAAIRDAAERAKKFWDKLEAMGISYTTLLGLMDEQMNMNDLTHRILLGWGSGEAFPNG